MVGRDYFLMFVNSEMSLPSPYVSSPEDTPLVTTVPPFHYTFAYLIMALIKH
jgi:hypothetical protein